MAAVEDTTLWFPSPDNLAHRFSQIVKKNICENITKINFEYEKMETNLVKCRMLNTNIVIF